MHLLLKNIAINGNSIIQKINEGDENVIPNLYRSYRQEFISWASFKYSASEEDAKDIFQEILISFYQSITEGKLTALSSDIKTYLFACGKNHLLNNIKKRSKVVNLFDSDIINRSSSDLNELNLKETKHYNEELIQNAISQLSVSCQKVVTLYYYNEYDMDSIANELNYKNTNVTKKKKCDCMKKLACIVKEMEEKKNL